MQNHVRFCYGAYARRDRWRQISRRSIQKRGEDNSGRDRPRMWSESGAGDRRKVVGANGNQRAGFQGDGTIHPGDRCTGLGGGRQAIHDAARFKTGFKRWAGRLARRVFVGVARRILMLAVPGCVRGHGLWHPGRVTQNRQRQRQDQHQGKCTGGQPVYCREGSVWACRNHGTCRGHGRANARPALCFPTLSAPNTPRRPGSTSP